MMSSIIDPAKMKVVDLRAELSKRGLDSKGNKPALVKRLKDALEEEFAQEIPDTSIIDTSTEDVDSSKVEENPIEDVEPPEKLEEKQEVEEVHKEIIEEDVFQTSLAEADNVPVTEDVVVAEETTENTIQDVENEPKEDEEDEEEEMNVESVIESNEQESSEVEVVPEDVNLTDANVEHIENGEPEQQEEAKSRKSRWGEADVLNNQQESVDENQLLNTENKKECDNSVVKVEKRRRDSQSSPDRSQRRRSRSPIREDEPLIDNNKVQLSWYDSDLHLQLDKESFLSAKPYHEGAFGYAWAGVRATHGVTFGKICYEVKITEELKWDDFSKQYDRNRRDSYRSNDSKYSKDLKDKNEGIDERGKGEVEKRENQNTEKNEEKTDEPMEQEALSTMSEDSNVNKMEIENIEESKEEVITKEEQQGAEIENVEEKPEDQQEKDQQQQQQEEELEKSKTEQPNKEPETFPTHLFRVGWSLPNTALQLGEDKYSYAFESSGKFVTNKEFSDYGTMFGVGDVISTFLNIHIDKVTITYAVNGVEQPEAISIDRIDLPTENCAFFPHVLSRNYAFEFNLGSREEPWFSKPDTLQDYEFLDKAQEKVAGPVRPESRSECEVILMCGLPASGKTHWVKEYVEANPNKQYTLLGNTHLLEKMTVHGDPLKQKYKGRWNILIDKLQKCLNKLIEIAALRRRNYIIDQTNVFPSAQRRKLRPFEGFKRRAVVVVVGDEEQAKRQSLQEAQDGKDVSDTAMLEMKAGMSLPQKGDWIDEIVYAELGENEAKTQVQKYNTEARDAGYGNTQNRFSHRDNRNRWQNRRNDYRSGNYRDNRNYHNQRYDRGPQRQGNWHSNRNSGWNNRDRRDNRGPPQSMGGGGSRDWRTSRGRDRGNRDNHNQLSNYNRNRNPRGGSGGSGGGGGWQSSGSGSGGGWQSQSQGSWNNQAWDNQSSWNGGAANTWSSQQSQNQWRYGGGGGSGQNYGNYSNWNYYGQYAQQNWNSQTPSQSSNTSTSSNQYGQYPQQWAQYAQQYAQGQQQQQQSTGGTTSSSTSSQQQIQK